MEAQTDIHNYLEQGKRALAQGQGREAGLAYSYGAQIEPENPVVHLGLAQANLALQNYGVVQMAARRVIELEGPEGTEARIAQALLLVLDRRYDQALQIIDRLIEDVPDQGYIHALRAYLLQAVGQEYDGSLALRRAARLSQGSRFDNCFPPLAPHSVPTPVRAAPVAPTPEVVTSTPRFSNNHSATRRWQIRARAFFGEHPGIVTYTLIAINLIAFLLSWLQPQLLQDGAQIHGAVLQGQWWRIFTAMFLHFNIFHIILNMLSLYMIGMVVEMYYGAFRYILLYLVSGILAGLFDLGMSVLNISFTGTVSSGGVGASGAIFGLVGALGVFYFINRRALGIYGKQVIGNWVFWVGINFLFGVMNPQIGIMNHLGGLIAGIILGFLFSPSLWKRRRV